MSCSRHRGRERKISRSWKPGARGHATRELILSDSLAVILAATKGRSSRRATADSRLPCGGSLQRSTSPTNRAGVVSDCLASMRSSKIRSSTPGGIKKALAHAGATTIAGSQKGARTEPPCRTSPCFPVSAPARVLDTGDLRLHPPNDTATDLGARAFKRSSTWGRTSSSKMTWSQAASTQLFGRAVTHDWERGRAPVFPQASVAAVRRGENSSWLLLPEPIHAVMTMAWEAVL